MRPMDNVSTLKDGKQTNKQKMVQLRKNYFLTHEMTTKISGKADGLTLTTCP